MSQAVLYGVGGKSTPTLFRQLANRSITTVTADDLAGVTTIGYYAFARCRHLMSVTISDTVISIDESAFYFCDSLLGIIIPGSVTSIGGQAFQYCSRLTSLTIQEGVTSIGGYAFQNCGGLTGIIIPGSVTSIGSGVFINCISLTRIIIKASTPPTLSNSNAFNNTNNCPIYVPFYTTTATNWVDISARLFPLVETVADLSNIDTTSYTKACVIGVDESYKEYIYDGSTWNEII